MSEFTFPDYQRPSHSHRGGDELTKLCLCCLEKDVTFVNLSTCKHFENLEKLCSISVPKMELGHLVCYRCHAKLKTIYDFKRQAEESFSKLWSRQYPVTKMSPKLKEVLLVEAGVNVEYLPEQLYTYRTPIKPEENPVTDHSVVFSGSWLSDPHCPPAHEASSHQEMFRVPLTKIKKEHSEKYHIIEVSGLYPDSPQENAAMSDVDRDDMPLAKIKREVEIEITELQTHAQVGGARSTQFADGKTDLTKAALDTEKVLFYCNECNKKFKSKKILRVHNINIHHHPKIIQTSNVTLSKKQRLDVYAGIIKQITLSHEELMLEREMERKSETYLQRLHRCDLCIVSFHEEQILKDHQKKHEMSGKLFQCDVCKCVYETNSIKRTHQKKHYLRFECGVCQKRYSSLTSITDHCNNIHELKNKLTYSCGQCNYTTTTHGSYAYHVQKHKGQSLCLICYRTFATKAQLRLHTFHNHGKSREEPIQCIECNKTYKSRQYLEYHNRRKHRAPSLPSTASTPAAVDKGPTTSSYCNSCNTFFKNDRILQNHYKRHKRHRNEDDKKFVCDICNRKFFLKNEIAEHITWMHLKIIEHTCPQCNKSYPSKSTLRKHVKSVHDKVFQPRNKICDYCGEGFTTEGILRSHIRRHTGERPYQCAQCPATFAHSGARYKHISLVHTKSHKLKS